MITSSLRPSHNSFFYSHIFRRFSVFYDLFIQITEQKHETYSCIKEENYLYTPILSALPQSDFINSASHLASPIEIKIPNFPDKDRSKDLVNRPSI